MKWLLVYSQQIFLGCFINLRLGQLWSEPLQEVQFHLSIKYYMLMFLQKQFGKM